MTQRFTDQHLQTLRNEFAKIATVNPEHLWRFGKIFADCEDYALGQLATANINFVSKLAVNECFRRRIRCDVSEGELRIKAA